MSSLISCVMCTYRRSTCVERAIQFFLQQRLPDDNWSTELIIYNTDTDYPVELSKSIKELETSNKKIRVINNNTNYVTGKPYDNVGDIRRDSISHARGVYYICWDDDDIYLPWNIQQCIDGLLDNPDTWSWKPFRSMFWKPKGDSLWTAPPPQLAGNVMEASIISRLDKVIEFGFKPCPGGAEHLTWVDAFRRNKKIVIEKESIPGYCFNWADQGEMRGHKQSGTCGDEDNFNRHKSRCKDYAKAPLDVYSQDIIDRIYDIHIKAINQYIGKELDSNHHGYQVCQATFNKYCYV